MPFARVLLVFCAVCAPAPSQAQDVRAQLPVEPAQVFSALLAMTDRSDWSRLDAALVLIEPLLDQVDQNSEGDSGFQLRSAIVDRDRERTRDALLRFVIFAVSDVLHQASTHAGSPACRELVRVAFSEYASVSPMLKERAFDTHRTLEQGFRKAYTQSEHDPTGFVATVEGLVLLLAQSGGAV